MISLGSLCLAGVLAACGGATHSATDVVPEASGLTAIEIARLLYADEARTPVDFYREPPRDSRYFYATFHLHNTRLDSAAAADPGATEFELCAQGRHEADTWEQLDRQYHAPDAGMLSFAESEAVYEYERDVPGAPDRREVVKIFKCAFIDRSTVNLRAPDGQGGRINVRPITALELRFVAEYLWTFSFYNNAGNAVLESRPGNGAGVSHELIQAELQPGSGREACDWLTVFEARYAAAPDSGDLSYVEQTLWTVRVGRDDGRVYTCH